MKIKRRKTPYGYIKWSAYSFKDITNCKHPEFKGNKKFKSYYYLLGPYVKKVDSERFAKKIIKKFFDMVLMDMILNNYEYVLPYEDFCSLHIGYKTFEGKYNNGFRYNIHTGGYFFLPRTRFTDIGRKRIHNTIFYMSLGAKYKKILEDEIDNGHRYSND